MPKTLKVTSKGQITLPKFIRLHLGSQTVEVEPLGEGVILRPVKSVGGSLSKYAKAAPSMKGVREQVWTEVSREKVKNASS